MTRLVPNLLLIHKGTHILATSSYKPKKYWPSLTFTATDERKMKATQDKHIDGDDVFVRSLH